MTEDDDWQVLLDELTPCLELSEHVTASWSQGWILVNWYESKVKIHAGDVELRGRTVKEALLAELAELAPVSPTEAYLNKGYVAYGDRRWEVHVPRNGRCKIAAWDNKRYSFSQFAPLAKEHFQVSTKGGVITVDHHTICAASVLAQGMDYVADVLNDYYTMTDTTRVLVVHRPHMPVMFGHYVLIERMSAEMDVEHAILDINELRPPRGRS